MTLNARDGVGAALNVAAAGATKFNIYGYTAALSTQLIGAVTLDNDTFTDGDPTGTVVGAIAVAMNATSPSFSGTFSVTGADAAHFQISGSNLETLGTAVEGTYHINIVATANSTIGNSPKTTAFTITGEPASGYTAPAVHFDGSAYLSVASLSCTDGPVFSFVCWVRPSAAIDDYITIGVADPLGSFDSQIYLNNAAGDTGTPRFNVATLDFMSNISMESSQGAIAIGTWVPFFGKVSFNHDDPDKTGQVFIGNTNASQIADQQGAAFTSAFNGLPYYVGSDTFVNMPFDLADLRIMPNVDLDFSDLATRRLFIDADGKPVDPAVATAALGAPCILFSGDATTFATNQGTGGAFTLTGALTNASTSPSG